MVINNDNFLYIGEKIVSMPNKPRGASRSLKILLAEMHCKPLEPEPDSTGVGMVKRIVRQAL
jgi:hypothetical protein